MEKIEKIKNEKELQKYEKHYSEEGFWEKVKSVAKKAGCEIIEKALILYYLALGNKVPLKDKMLIFAGLGYFILPIDLVPDLTPIIGYSDDLAAFLFILSKLDEYIDDEIKQKAKNKLNEIFDGGCK